MITASTFQGEQMSTVKMPRCNKISPEWMSHDLRLFSPPFRLLQDCPEEWQRGLSAGLDPMSPMDTIFVKHVKENGPAAKAGLCNGESADRRPAVRAGPPESARPLVSLLYGRCGDNALTRYGTTLTN